MIYLHIYSLIWVVEIQTKIYNWISNIKNEIIHKNLENSSNDIKA